jgi:hypothetical protein
MAARLPFSERLKSAETALIVARASFDIWWLYASNETRPRYLDVMNDYPDFFRYDEEGHFRNAVVTLWTLFDGRRDTVTLRSLITEAGARGLEVATPRARLKRLEPRLEKIETLRHKLFAHRDHSLEYESVYAIADITPDDLRSTLDESLLIFNELATLHNLPKTEFRSFPADDARRLLERLRSECE